MIPLELFTMGVSVLGGGILKLFGMAMQTKRLQMEALVQAAGFNQAERQNARNWNQEGVAWTRRTIAILATLSIIVIPKLAALLLGPEFFTAYGTQNEITKTFLWFFSSTQSVVVWDQVIGLPITPLDTHLMSAIVGLYFGSSITGSGR